MDAEIELIWRAIYALGKSLTEVNDKLDMLATGHGNLVRACGELAGEIGADMQNVRNTFNDAMGAIEGELEVVGEAIEAIQERADGVDEDLDDLFGVVLKMGDEQCVLIGPEASEEEIEDALKQVFGE